MMYSDVDIEGQSLACPMALQLEVSRSLENFSEIIRPQNN